MNRKIPEQDKILIYNNKIFPDGIFGISAVFPYFCSMYRFIEYISDLLFLHDCVIIPDFGGFICNYKSAYVDRHSGLLCPPAKAISFNRSLTHNDGLLADWIACKEKISYEKANTLLALFCEDLKVRLNRRQSVSFGRIGVFFTDRHFNIIFEPSESNFFADTFGMEPVKIPSGENGKSLPPTASAAKVPEMSACINMENTGNFLHRLMKYALAAATVTGIAVITQLDVFHGERTEEGTYTNRTAMEMPAFQPAAPTPKLTCSNVISPDSDYIDYDPAEDLERQEKRNSASATANSK